MNLIITIYALLLTILSINSAGGQVFGNWHNQLSKHVIKAPEASSITTTNSTPIKYTEYPYKSSTYQPYQAQARAAAVYDQGSAQMLYQKNAQMQLPIASITKLATALVILQHHQIDEIVTIPDGIKLPSDSEKVGLTPGEKFRLDEALRIMLIPSANDMAEALAVWDSRSREDFIVKMNQQAKTWGLNNTHFANPTGLDEKDHYSSAQDLITIATIVLQNSQIREISATSRYNAHNLTGKSYTLVSTNKLLVYDYFKGLKTGLTVQAGQTLISLAEKSGHSLIGVVLNSPNRFQESKNMLDWAFANYTWK